MRRINKMKNDRTRSVDWKGIVVDSLYLRDGGICQLCKKSLNNDDLFEIDHIVKRADDGKDTLMNLRLVHLACHKKRHTRNFTELTPLPINYDDYYDDDIPTMNVNFKKLAHLQLLKALKHGLSKTNKLKEACTSCGITFDQGRYYLQLYNLDWKEYDSWDLDKLSIKQPQALTNQRPARKAREMKIKVVTETKGDESGTSVEEKWFRAENKSLDKYIERELDTGRIGTVTEYDSYKNIIRGYNIY